jgi:hypothetical protein
MAKHAAVKAPAPIEHKVIQPTAWSGLLGIVIAVLNGLAAGPGVLDSLSVPKVYQGLILAVIPPLVVLISGYVAPHSPRVDLEEPKPTDADWAAAAAYFKDDAATGADEMGCGH